MTGHDGDSYSIHIGHDVSGQVVAGQHNVVSRVDAAKAIAPVSDADLAELRAEFARVRALVRQEAGAEAKRAEEQLANLERAAIASEPDLSTMDTVRRWFAHHLPKLAGAVFSLLVHPVVGRLAEHAGDAIAEEFHRRFDTGAGDV